MTRADLVARLRSSGLDFLTLEQANQFVNEACAEFQSEELWPWRLATAAGVAPLYIVNLGPIDFVTVPARRLALRPQRQSSLIDQFGNFDSTNGFANYYYPTFDNSVGGTINIVPNSAEPIKVTHYAKAFWRDGVRTAQTDSDQPACPAETHELIDLLARERALRWNHELDEADRLRSYYGTRLEEMKDKETKALGGWDEPDITRENADW